MTGPKLTPMFAVWFWAFLQLGNQLSIGDCAVIGTLVVAAAAYALSIKQDRRIRDEQMLLQQKMHTENTERLESLIRFRTFQEQLNEKRDQQLNALTSMAATTAEALKGFNRRLELMEDKK